MNPNPFLPFLESRGVVVLDGGSATALEALGYSLDARLWSAALIREAPEAIVQVHRAYLEAGADCIASVSYQASFPGLAEASFDDDEAARILLRSSELALEARDAYAAGSVRPTDRDAYLVDPVKPTDRAVDEGPDGPVGGDPPLMPLVAASVGPYGAYLADGSEYDGRYGISDDELRSFHERRLHLLAGSGVDLVACETIPSSQEARVLLKLLADRPEDVPAWMSFSCRDGGRLHDGTPIEEVAAACATAERVVAMGVNCTAPEHVPELARRIRTATELLVLTYPNSGEGYDASTGTWSGGSTPTGGWLRGVLEAREAGTEIVGGCCRVGPDDIRELRRCLAARD